MRLAFDVESDGLLDQLTRIHSLVIENLDTGEFYSCSDQPGWRTTKPNKPGIIHLTIREGVEMLMIATELIGHNIIKFDIPAIQKVYPWFKPTGKLVDTLVLTRLIFTMIWRKREWVSLIDWDGIEARMGRFPGRLKGSHTLEAWGYRLGEWKGDYAAIMAERGLDPWAFWNTEMQAYCEQDVVVTTRLYRRIERENYSQPSIDLELAFAEIIAQQERYGFGFDEEKAASLYVTLVAKREEIAAKLQASFPPITVRETKIAGSSNKNLGRVKGQPYVKETIVVFNPSSRQMIAARLKDLGWDPQEFTPSGQPKVDETILQALPWPEAQVLAEHFLIEKRIGQLAEGDQAWLKLVRGGAIHGSVNTNGAVTGRCTHSNPNVAQAPAVGSPFGAECRELFRARLGALVGADLSGLELRCLAHFMAVYDGGAYARILLEGDVHWVNVIALGLVPEGTERDEKRFPLHKILRDKGAKTFIYAFLYGAGDEKIGSIVLDLAIREQKAGLGTSVFKTYFPANNEQGYLAKPGPKKLKAIGKQLKASFLEKTPALKKLREAVTSAAARGYLVGLDGRKLYIRSPHAALNTLLQSAGALIAKQATILAYRKLTALGLVFGQDWALVAHVHDEMQSDTKPDLAELVGTTVVEAMRETGIHFKFRCPIDGEFKIGNNWKETH